MNAARNFDLIFFDLVRARAPQRNCSSRTVQCLLKRDENIRFDVGAAFGSCFAAAESAESRTAAAAAKKRFKKIAEAGPAKFKLDSAAAIATPLIKPTARLTAPLRRRLKSARLVPICSELIVFLALFRIAQDF